MKLVVLTPTSIYVVKNQLKTSFKEKLRFHPPLKGGGFQLS